VRPIIDAHHHLWQLGRFPYTWLAPEAPPRPFGDHSAAKRDYLLADYRSDMDEIDIVGSVFVEANAGAPATSEIDWVDEVAGKGQFPTAAVGSLDLRRPDAPRILSAFCRSPRMRGIRMSVCWDERPQWRFIDRPDVMLTKEFRLGLAALTRCGLVFDILVVPGQLQQLAELAHDHPDQPIVLNHLGTPWFETDADKTAWAEGMRACARCRNVCVKISGLWALDRAWRPHVIGPPVRYVIDLFGPERCLWASNLPLEKLMCPVNQQIRNLEEVLTDFTEPDKDQIFRLTAARVYRVKV
jgi:predicted TIM-barrel fold metal-dependent hydrolase